jgi:hypothetical protein
MTIGNTSADWELTTRAAPPPPPPPSGPRLNLNFSICTNSPGGYVTIGNLGDYRIGRHSATLSCNTNYPVRNKTADGTESGNGGYICGDNGIIKWGINKNGVARFTPKDCPGF